MEHRLSAVGVRIHHDAIAALRDSDFPRQIARETEQLAQEGRILRLVEGGHVMRRDHEEMRGRLRVQIRERQDTVAARSEEHTSELQSLAYLVCRLLLEKKKKNNTTKKSARSNTKYIC